MLSYDHADATIRQTSLNCDCDNVIVKIIKLRLISNTQVFTFLKI